ncbi:MAG: dUTP diphosphatase [Alphaproteobacteria bacterium]|nr:dUTP diphosphatase [Alphaproteobacteria bacterium]
MDRFQVAIVNLNPELSLPEYATPDSAGMDVLSADSLVLKPGNWRAVSCGFKIALPSGYEAQIRPRSGWALRHGVTILNAPGTIDADYRGEVHALLINHGKEDFVIKHGMRIAQMVIASVQPWAWHSVDDLDATGRGALGFGSSGV